MIVNDCIVIGGGPAGCAAAIRLRQKTGGSVLVIDRSPPPGRYQIGESAAPSVVPLLQQLGITGDLAAYGHIPCYGNRTIWGSEEVEEQDYMFKGLGHGWHLDRGQFDQQLAAHAQRTGVAWLMDWGLVELGWWAEQGCWGLVLEQGGERKQVFGRTLVDASGNRSVVASRLGAKRQRIDSLTAVAAILPAKGSLGNLSVIEACEQGWWYGADIPDKRLVVTLMTDADVLKQEGVAELSRFRQLLSESHLLSDLSRSADMSALQLYPASTGWLDSVAGPGWAAAGNAAISMDPLTSAGINCALQDGIAVAEALAAWLDGEPTGLRQYAQRMDRAVGQYLAERQAFYQLERRWPDSPFWQRRRSQSFV